ncbi:MAG: DUF4091 domain-containing protein [Deltaproteobacteria bacterium]
MFKPRPSSRWPLSLFALGLALSTALPFSAARADTAPAAYVVDTLTKVTGSWSPAGQSASQAGVQLFAAGGEVAAFQVALVGNANGAKGVSAELSPLADGNGDALPAAGATLFRETYLSLAQPSDGGGGTGLFPDGLVPDHDEVTGEARNAFPTDIPPNQAGAIWVDVRIPAGQKSAVYTGTLQLTGGLTQQIQLQITVYPFDLPATSSLRSAFLAFTGNICAKELGSQAACATPAGQKLLAEYEQLALDHRITLTNDYPVDPTVDLSGFDQAMAPFMNGSGPTRLSGAKMTSLQYGLPQGGSGYATWLSNVQSQGWADRTFDYAADEPGAGASSWSQELTNVTAAQQSAPALPTLVTTTVQAIAQNGGAMPSILSPVINELDDVSGTYAGDQLPAYASFLQGGGKLWMYQSCMSHGCAFGGDPTQSGWPSYMIDATGVRNRAMQWADFEEGVAGELYYETVNAYDNDPWTDQYRFGGNGDGTLFYPGSPSVVGGQDDAPFASLRLKLIRAGMEDYEYLKKVSDLGDPGFAQTQARAVVPSLHAVAADPGVLHQARASLAGRILQLTNATLPGSSSPGGGSGGTGSTGGGGSAPQGGGAKGSGASAGDGGSGGNRQAAGGSDTVLGGRVPSCGLVGEDPRCLPGMKLPGSSEAPRAPGALEVHGRGCQTGAGSASVVGALLGLALLALRRRRGGRSESSAIRS